MSRLHKVLLGVFCSGILLCGVGVGIAFGDFSSLAYGGEKTIGDTKMVTEDFDAEIEPGENPWSIYGYFGRGGVSELTTDEEVPENTVRFRVTYNAERMEPRVEVWKEAQEVNMYPVWTDYDEMALFMEAKDEVLADLKKGKLSFYTSIGAEKIEVLVNPANEEDVRLVY